MAMERGTLQARYPQSYKCTLSGVDFRIIITGHHLPNQEDSPTIGL